MRDRRGHLANILQECARLHTFSCNFWTAKGSDGMSKGSRPGVGVRLELLTRIIEPALQVLARHLRERHSTFGDRLQSSRYPFRAWARSLTPFNGALFLRRDHLRRQHGRGEHWTPIRPRHRHGDRSLFLRRIEIGLRLCLDLRPLAAIDRQRTGRQIATALHMHRPTLSLSERRGVVLLQPVLQLVRAHLDHRVDPLMAETVAERVDVVPQGVRPILVA